MPYTYSVNLLSAEATGYPNQIGCVLSANGVNIISLSSVDQGIAFNPVSTLNGVLSTVTVTGSVFKIDTAYDQSDMALIKVLTPDIIEYYTRFTYLSTTVTATPSAAIIDVSTQDMRRMRHLGYI